MAVKISDLGAGSALADANLFLSVQSGTTYKSTIEDVRKFTWDNSSKWYLIDTDYYTATPASTTRITCSTTTDFTTGLPVKYTYGGTTYYGIITAVSASAYIDIAGATLDTGVALTALHVGTPDLVVQKSFMIRGDYNSVGDILSNDEQYFRWDASTAYLVWFSATVNTSDTTDEAKINVKVNDQFVSSNDSNNGIQLSGTDGTWADNPAVSITIANYDILFGETVKPWCTVVGGTADGTDLSMSCVFVLA